jgi:hypothetical protein
MIGDRHEIPRFQSDFYRDNYRKMVRWIFTSVLIMLFLILAIIYFELFVPSTKYYASTVTGQLIELTPYGN